MWETFWKDYFIDSKISNYKDYTKKKYWDLCDELIDAYKIQEWDRILDFGCACGNLVREFVDRRYDNIIWTDISKRAISYWINQWLWKYLQEYTDSILTHNYNFIFMLDVLEHIPLEWEIQKLLTSIKEEVEVIIRVPVSNEENWRYVLDVSENDKTHVQRHTKERWIKLFKMSWFTHIWYITLNNIYDSNGVLAVLIIKEWQK